MTDVSARCAGSRYFASVTTRCARNRTRSSNVAERFHLRETYLAIADDGDSSFSWSRRRSLAIAGVAGRVHALDLIAHAVLAQPVPVERRPVTAPNR